MAQSDRTKLDKLGARRALIKKDTEKLEEDARKVIAEARLNGIEAAEVVERTGWSRAWLYREYAAEMRIEDTVETPTPTPS